MTIKFNSESYLKANLDVESAIANGEFSDAFEHYQKYGRLESRGHTAYPANTREEKSLALINREGIGLEIGPSHNPIAPRAAGYNVEIVDHLTKEGLREKYADHGVDINKIEDVDYVWNGQPITELIGKKEYYDFILASHVIEHIPNLLFFLKECESLLKRGGVLSLVISDKRYCFDYFNPISGTGEILDAWLDSRTRPSPGQVFNHIANASKKEGSIAWDKDTVGNINLVHTFLDAKNLFHHAKANPDYIDVHCWRFTPASFRLLINDLRELGLISLEVLLEYPTSGCEFYISLGQRKGQNCNYQLSRLDLLSKVLYKNNG